MSSRMKEQESESEGECVISSDLKEPRGSAISGVIQHARILYNNLKHPFKMCHVPHHTSTNDSHSII